MAGNAGAIRAGKAYVEVYADRSPLARGLALVGGQLKSWGAKAAVVAGGVTAAAGAAIAAGIGASVKHFVEAGSAMVDMSARTGASVEALSTLGFAAAQTGATIEDVETGFKKFAKSGLGAGKSAEAGFRDALRTIAAIQDPVERSRKAMELFGKSGTALIPMAMQLDALEARARELGLEMSTSDAEAADSLGDAWDELVAVGGMLGVKIGAVVAPALQQMVEWGVEVIGVVGRWVESNQEAIQSFLRVATSGDVLWAGLKVAWLEGVNALGEIFLLVEEAIMPVWAATLDEALVIIGELQKAWSDFGAWFEETMSGVADFVFDKMSNISGEIGAALLDAIGQTDAAANQRAENERAAQERKDIRAANRAGPRKGKDFAAIDAATDAARAAVPDVVRSQAKDLRDKIAAARADLLRAREDLTNAVDAARAPVEAPGAKGLKNAAGEIDLGKSSVSGTFSASAASGLAGGSRLDEIATATKQTAKNTKNLANLQPGLAVT